MIGEIRQNFTEASASVGLILATALYYKQYGSLKTLNLRIVFRDNVQGDSQPLMVVFASCLRTSVLHLVCLIWKLSSGCQRTAFFQAMQNGTQTAIVFAHQSKTQSLKSSGFWFYNIITHWEHPGKGMQKSNQNRNVEVKNHESNLTVIITINWEFD